jgi:uncharacterized membrane protein YsdA (DUF1294 family)/cold shock CspA family protein
MQREKGQLVGWNDDKGYGFIPSPSACKDVFLHIKALPPHQRRPRTGDQITYRLVGSETDKPSAADARICGFAWSWFTLLCACVLPLLGLYAWGVWRHWVAVQPIPVLYVLMSLLTIAAYHRDKCSAKTGSWRTSEKQLHFLELCFGWPGAFLAQIFFRHKLKKLSYQIVFWSIVFAHCTTWYAVSSGLLTRQAFDAASEKLAASMRAPHLEPGPNASAAARSAPPSEPEPMRASEPQNATHLANTGWEQDEPTEPILNDPDVHRSRVVASKQNRRLTGQIKAVSQSRGLLVTLPSGFGGNGIIAPSTLISDFHRRFRIGEQVLVSIRGINMQGSQTQFDLLLVDPETLSTHAQTQRSIR